MRALRQPRRNAGDPVGELHRAVGRNIRERRRELRLTLEALEDRCGVGAAFIGQIERTDKRGSVETLTRIAGGLSVPLGRLLVLDRAAARPAGAWLSRLLRPHGERELALMYDTLRLLSRRVRALPGEARRRRV